MKTNKAITEINLQDAHSIYDKANYVDEDVFFADNITSMPNLSKVFKVNFYAFMFCLKGDFSLVMNSVSYELHTNDGLFVDANSVVDDWQHSDDFSCVICAFRSNVAFSFMNKRLFDAIMQIRTNPVIRFTHNEIALMVKYYELAKFKMEHPELNYGRETMVNILRGYTYDLLSNMNRHLENDPGKMLTQGDKLFRKFMLMLADGQSQGRSVQFYADELCVSPKYLTSICHQHAGKTASELIVQSVVERIKQALLYSDMTIKEVATYLGFDNLSFFGKYVKKHLGVSPNNYRRMNNYGK